MGNVASSSDDSGGSECESGKDRDKVRKDKKKKDKKDKKDKKKGRDVKVGPTPLPEEARRIVRHFDSQVVFNHGRVDIPGMDNQNNVSKDSIQQQNAQATDSFHNKEGSVLGSILNSMMIAQRNFADSLRQVQTEDQPLVMLARMTNFDVATLRSLQAVFTAISCQDANDNLISARELCQSIGTSPESQLGRALFRILDLTRSNNINFRTWVLMLSKLSPQASIDDKIGFAFNLYDGDGDGYIDEAELVAMLRQAIIELSEDDAKHMIAHAFDQVDADRDHRINLNDYRLMANGSQSFYDSFTIDIPALLAQYNVISQEEVDKRVDKLRERDLRQDEKMNTPAQKARDKAFMEREEDDLHVVVDIDALDID